MRKPTLTLLMLLCTSEAAAQQTTNPRLQGAAPVVVRALDSALAQAAERGLPTEPLIQKAVEGTAKAAPPDRVVAALALLLTRLHVSAGALHAAGLATPTGGDIEAGAFALSTGLDSAAVSTLARRGEPSNAAATTLRVGATLHAMGVPAAQVLELVSQALQAGQPPGQLMALPGQVQAAIARGATPAAAATGVARAQQGGRPPDPPRRGPPPERAPPPQPPRP